MKNLLVIGAASILALSSVSAQQFSAKNFGVTGAGFVFEPDGTTKAPTATTSYDVVFGGTVVAGPKAGFGGAGQFSLGTVALSSGVNADGTATVTIRAWDNTTGTTFATATVKATEDVVVLTKVAPAPPVGLTNFKNLTLVNTSTLSPEPSTYALGALGLGGLLVISRRRK